MSKSFSKIKDFEEIKDEEVKEAEEIKETETSWAGYKVGDVYKTTTLIYVRKNPNKDAAIVAFNEIKDNKGLCVDNNGNAVLNSGVPIECKDVEEIGNDIWIKHELGWSLAYSKLNGIRSISK